MNKKKNELYFEVPDKEHNLVIDMRDDGQVVYLDEQDMTDEAAKMLDVSYTNEGFINLDDDNLDLEVRYEDQDVEVKNMLNSIDEIYKDLK